MKLERIKKKLYELSKGWSLLPFQLTINIANTCNRRCRMCPNHSPDLVEDWYQFWWRAQPNFMDYDKFEVFMKRMGLFNFFIRQISFTGRGETLLHKDILKFCKLANIYRIRFNITTNGDKLTAELEYELAKLSYLNYVRVSLFDVEQADYWFTRQRISPIQIRIENVTGKHVEGLKDGFLVSNNKGTDKYSTLPIGFVKESFCRAPFSFNTINTDGSLVTCITFIEVGNVFHESWWKCWNGKKMRLHRMNAMDFKIPEHMAFCRDCGYFLNNSKNDYWKLNKNG